MADGQSRIEQDLAYYTDAKLAEPDWVLSQEAERKKKELLEHEQLLEQRLEDIRTKEKLAADRRKVRQPDDERPRKKHVSSSSRPPTHRSIEYGL